ncbi:Tn3 family transposase [Serratia symbiotica]|nr:Tn3 family transposase [Serratia symbiotica]
MYYNSAILSRLLERLEAEGNVKGIEAVARISPVAWQHILLNRHYTFLSSNEIIDLVSPNKGKRLLLRQCLCGKLLSLSKSRMHPR